MADEVSPDGAVGQRKLAGDGGVDRVAEPFQPSSGLMALALAAARRAGDMAEVPVGAVVSDPSGRVLAVCGNRTRTDFDASSHAEMLAMRQAAGILRSERLEQCDLWVTLEPCAMCAAAAGLFRVRRIVYGAYDSKGGGIAHGARIFESSAGHRPEIIGGVQEIEAKALLRAFFRDVRQKI